MLYVTAGLAVMFGVVALLGLGAIDEATELVFHERLAAAHTTARVMERDFQSVAAAAREEAEEWASGSTPARSTSRSAVSFLDDLRAADPSSFFGVAGVWVLDPRGRLLDQAGSPWATPALEQSVIDRVGASSVEATVLEGVAPVAGATSFAAIVVPATRLPASAELVIVVHTVSVNSTAAYVPATHVVPSALEDAGGAADVSSPDQYHLEVIDPDGITVLGIGADERPGESSRHFHVSQGLMGQRGAAALLHEPAPGETFEPHVMAVVPVSATPFYLVLEQPVDVALALPLQLRERLLAWIAVGFIATLVVAWITTRHVVRPTEQLTEAARRMAEGNLMTPVAVTAQDEVGRLAESLDMMRERLLEANLAAEKTNRELESRVAERTARLGDTLRKTITAQEEERHRLARELHDETAQTLAAMSIELDRARDSLGDGESPTHLHVREAKGIATRLLEETRRLILGLRPAVLDDMGLVPALRWLCESSLSERGIEVTVTANLGPNRLPPHVEVALFRIAQEAVTNIARHARARHAEVRIARANGIVTLVVTDDGVGFDVAATMGTGTRADSVGLSGIQERVGLLDGTMEIRSAPGTGTTVIVRAPAGEGSA